MPVSLPPSLRFRLRLPAYLECFSWPNCRPILSYYRSAIHGPSQNSSHRGAFPGALDEVHGIVNADMQPCLLDITVVPPEPHERIRASAH